MKIGELLASTKSVPDEGLLTSSIPTPGNIMIADMAIVGDPPDTYECMERRPFHGANFKNFARLCAAVGIPKYKLYLTNSIKAKLDRKSYKKAYTAKGYRCPDWGILQKRLIDELSAFPGKVIVLMGDFAMNLLLDDPRINNLSKFRGSAYKAEQFQHLAEPLAGKIICITYAPYDFSPRMKPANFYIAMNDLTKFAALKEEPELLDVEPNIITQPKFQEVMDFLYDVKARTKLTSVDIEATPKFVTCFALTL
ncbi:MAG: uracil-DNA glycosylase family protein, partial [Dehalococcoidia bacterium]